MISKPELAEDKLCLVLSVETNSASGRNLAFSEYKTKAAELLSTAQPLSI
jgi:hypothetical protein